MADPRANPNDRFDALLRAMAPPSERKKPSTDQALGEASSACCSDTQTPPDTSEDGDC